MPRSAGHRVLPAPGSVQPFRHGGRSSLRGVERHRRVRAACSHNGSGARRPTVSTALGSLVKQEQVVPCRGRSTPAGKPVRVERRAEALPRDPGCIALRVGTPSPRSGRATCYIHIERRVTLHHERSGPHAGPSRQARECHGPRAREEQRHRARPPGCRGSGCALAACRGGSRRTSPPAGLQASGRVRRRGSSNLASGGRAPRRCDARDGDARLRGRSSMTTRRFYVPGSSRSISSTGATPGTPSRDTIDKLSPRSVDAAGETLVQLVRRLDG